LKIIQTAANFNLGLGRGF